MDSFSELVLANDQIAPQLVAVPAPKRFARVMVTANVTKQARIITLTQQNANSVNKIVGESSRNQGAPITNPVLIVISNRRMPS
jgi:predicted lactoylglutathione lyase